MCFKSKNKSIIIFLFGVFIALFILALVLVSILSFYLKNQEDVGTGSKSPGENSLSGGEVKQLRTQEEIIEEYKVNMSALLGKLENSQAGSQEILTEIEAGFFDIFVPNHLRELHVQTLLQIQSMEDEEWFNDTKILKEEIRPLLEKLIEESDV